MQVGNSLDSRGIMYSINDDGTVRLLSPQVQRVAFEPLEGGTDSLQVVADGSRTTLEVSLHVLDGTLIEVHDHEASVVAVVVVTTAIVTAVSITLIARVTVITAIAVIWLIEDSTLNGVSTRVEKEEPFRVENLIGDGLEVTGELRTILLIESLVAIRINLSNRADADLELCVSASRDLIHNLPLLLREVFLGEFHVLVLKVRGEVARRDVDGVGRIVCSSHTWIGLFSEDIWI